MTVVLLGPPTLVEASLVIPAGVIFESWLNWVDGTPPVTVDLTGWHALLAFSAGGAGEIVPVAVSDVSNPATVGQIVCGAASPNMKITIPAAVTAALAFRRLRATLDVTDLSGVPRRWLEATVTLDRGTGF